MLNTQTLVERVTAPARADRRTIEFAAYSVNQAQSLKDQKYADKTTTRIVNDALMTGADYLLRDGSMHDDEKQYLSSTDAKMSPQLALRNVNLSLSPKQWDTLIQGAEQMKWPLSRFIRVVGFIALEQVYNELTGR